jgi:hypothetical protein
LRHQTKGSFRFDLARLPQAHPSPQIEIDSVIFHRPNGDEIRLRCSSLNRSDCYPARAWIDLRNRITYAVRRRIKEIQVMGSSTRWPLTKWHFEKHFQRHVGTRMTLTMTWANYGYHWSIHHILPMACFNLYDPRQRRLCQSLSNLRPIRCWQNSFLRNVVTLGDVTQYIKGRIELLAYIRTRKK